MQTLRLYVVNVTPLPCQRQALAVKISVDSRRSTSSNGTSHLTQSCSASAAQIDRRAYTQKGRGRGERQFLNKPRFLFGVLITSMLSGGLMYPFFHSRNRGERGDSRTSLLKTDSCNTGNLWQFNVVRAVPLHRSVFSYSNTKCSAIALPSLENEYTP